MYSVRPIGTQGVNEKVRRKHGVENLEHRLQKMKLRCFGHVKRTDENIILRRVMEPEVEGRRQVGKPKKTWSKVVKLLHVFVHYLTPGKNITEDMAEDRKQWRQLISHHRSGKLETINKDDDE